jgi:tRNA 2-thiouridine synthesizing protein A
MDMTSPDLDPPAHDALIDVGDTLCGELALLLRGELRKLEPGQVLEVIARDPAAPQDLPAWCELTGNPLLHVAHPHYWISRKSQ